MGRWHLMLVAGAVLALEAGAAQAGFIGDACVRAGRPEATRAMCTCIDKVAKNTLSRPDRRRGAKLFKNPHEAQRIRQSSRKSDEAFWEAWKTFGEKAEKSCG